MSRMRPLLLGALALALVLPSAQAKPRGKDKPVIVTAQDMLIREGSSVTLRAKLEREGFGFGIQEAGVAEDPLPSEEIDTEEIGAMGIWRSDIKGRQLSFFLGEKKLGGQITDKEGFATYTWTPPGVGDYLIQARFGGDHKYAPGSDSLMVSVRSRETPITVLDIDHTLSHTSNKNVLKGKIDDKPLEHSLNVVKRFLEEGRTMIYVSARLNKFNDVTRRWLDHHGYPRRPTYFLDIKRYPTYNEAKYKTVTLSRIRQSFPNMVLGVGDKDSDAEAYRAVGMRALILGDAGDVEGAEEVENWHQIEDLLYSPRKARFQEINQE